MNRPTGFVHRGEDNETCRTLVDYLNEFVQWCEVRKDIGVVRHLDKWR